MIQIIKASAGSGKTYTLTQKYIELLLRSKDNSKYRHILAVTFTNKATEEMKSRILKELDRLAREPEKSPYFEAFVPSVTENAELLKKRAESILIAILHDYAAFSISTIDKFFQRTLKAFSREIGQFASYQLELDRQSLIEESVDKLLDSLSKDNKFILKWLINTVLEQIDLKGGFNIRVSLLSIARRLLFFDTHKEIIAANKIDREKFYSEENLENVRKKCFLIIKDFNESVKLKAQKIFEHFKECDLHLSDFKRNLFDPITYYLDLNTERYISKIPTDSFFSNAVDPEKWFKKKEKDKHLSKVSKELCSAVGDFCEMFGRDYVLYNTANAIKNQIFDLGILMELERRFEGLLKEKNVLSIDDTNRILRNIIDAADAPFIYEKLGLRYENFLLDEFQDTSTVQWANFLPLLRESVANGYLNLIVGDVKQSIYRWRGSDWNLLNTKIEKEFTGSVKTDVLKDNWRSCVNIVEFNNAFFSFASKYLDNIYYGKGDEQLEDKITLEHIYSASKQNARRTAAYSGSVNISFCRESKEEEEIIAAIKNIINKGSAKYSDIAILTRTNEIARKISELLIKNDINVISDEALKVKSSNFVNKLVSLLYYADNPFDSGGINSFGAKQMSIKLPKSYHSIVDLAEYMIKQLVLSGLDSQGGEAIYLYSFMDILHDWTNNNGNSLGAFLKYWEGVDPAIPELSDNNAVRIISIHKSKGLEFPYVIFPYAEKVELFNVDSQWCVLEQEENAPEEFLDGAYSINLSSKTEKSLFAGTYRKEKFLSYVDALNVFYVALTRAEKVLYIIAKTPSEKCREFVAKSLNKEDETNDNYSYSDLSQLLYVFVNSSLEDTNYKIPLLETSTSEIVRYGIGELNDNGSNEEISDKSSGENPDNGIKILKCLYPSFPLNEELEGLGKLSKRRISFGNEAMDFFSSEGRAEIGAMVGIQSSKRLRGVVLHDILSKVKQMEDLAPAVKYSADAGQVSKEEASEIFVFLKQKIEFITNIKKLPWFTLAPQKIFNELEIIDLNGNIFRPDKVLKMPDNQIFIIDYKFAERSKSYVRQLERYLNLYFEMGYTKVSGALWYVLDDEVAYL